MEIVARCGRHQPEGFVVPGKLVRVRRLDDNKIRYQFVEFLCASDGAEEIFAAYDQAPSIKLEGEELAAAIEWAL